MKKLKYIFILIFGLILSGCKNIEINKLNINIEYTSEVVNYFLKDNNEFNIFKSSSEMKEYFKGDIYEDENYLHKQIDSLDNEGYFNKYSVIHFGGRFNICDTIEEIKIETKDNKLIFNIQISTYALNDNNTPEAEKIVSYLYSIDQSIINKHKEFEYSISCKTIKNL